MKKTNISQYLVDTIAGKLGQVGGGLKTLSQSIATVAQSSGWFSPLQPLPEMAPEDVAGRTYDFDVGYNIRIIPRDSEQIGFAMLREFADKHDLTRLLIETRKDLLCRQKFTIQTRDGKRNRQTKQIEQFLQRPDRLHTWESWLRMLVEEMLVTDAVSLYVRRTVGGDIYSLDPIDGSTIRPLIDYYGRSPSEPGDPAYVQYLKGVPAEEYTRDELIYAPRNVRTHKNYGFSPVEQIVMTINIALRRQIWQLNSFTEGNIPDCLVGLNPDKTTPSQMREIQEWFDAKVAGNLAEQRKAQFLPSWDEIFQPERGELFGAAEEWLARICCFAFGVSPQAFVQQQNRATAETAAEAAEAEGLAPLMQWVKSLIDDIIQRFFLADCELVWEVQSELDPKVQADIDKIYSDMGVYNIEYIQERMGIDKKYTGTPVNAANEPLDNAADKTGKTTQQMDKKPEKQAKQSSNDTAKADGQPGDVKKKDIKPIGRDRPAVAKPRKRLEKLFTAKFKKVAKAIVGAIGINKADDPISKEQLNDAMAELDRTDWTDTIDDTASILEDIGKAGVEAAAVQIGVDGAFNVANERAIEYARQRGAELVGKRVLADGTIIDNPNAHWAITETTRDNLRALTVQAEEEGWTATEFGAQVMDSEMFSGNRAMMIARTEAGFADIAGNLALYEESGIVKKKKWKTAGDSNVSDPCSMNAAAGVIDYDKPFPTGKMWPLQHPRCRCDLIPIIED